MTKYYKTRIAQLKTSATLLLIFLSSFLLLVGCGGYPKITLHAFDATHNLANPNLIKDYDQQKCELVLEQKPGIPICGLDASGKPVVSPYFQGGVFVAKEEYTKVKAKAKADCINKQNLNATQN